MVRYDAQYRGEAPLLSIRVIGLGKLDFGCLITDDCNMSYPDWLGAQDGNWSPADQSSIPTCPGWVYAIRTSTELFIPANTQSPPPKMPD